MRIVGMLRVKNEATWLKAVLDAAGRVCDALVVLDDGSTDATPEICRRHPKVAEYLYQEESVLDEARDKNRLLKMALQLEPDWILALDGDEVLEDAAPEIIRREIALIDPVEPQFVAFALQILYFWDDPLTFRCEPSLYGDFWQVRLFTTWGQDVTRLTFLPTSHGGNLHCGSVPANLTGRARFIDVKVKHYGYLSAETRQRKKEWYATRDPEAFARGYYDHLTSSEGMRLAIWQERRERDAVSSTFIKPTAYFTGYPIELISLLPPGTRRVLEVGCGYGDGGRAIKEGLPEVWVAGAEWRWTAYLAARAGLDAAVYWRPGEPLPFPDGFFDVVLLNHCLEKFADPWTVLSGLKRYVAPGGKVIATVANARNLVNLVRLAGGDWDYTATGVADIANLRFFTPRTAAALFAYCGFKVKEISFVPDPQIAISGASSAESTPFSLQAGNLHLVGLSGEDLAELTARDILVVAEKSAGKTSLSQSEQSATSPVAAGRTGPGSAGRDEPTMGKSPELISIIIPVFNQLSFTKRCLESIRNFTSLPYELIIIDNGSTDETSAFLKSQKDLKVITNESNRGFGPAVNQGLALARGEYLVVLNNDTLVTPGWLEELLYALKTGPAAGLAGPVTNYASGPQCIPVPYQPDNEESIVTFARERAVAYKGKIREVFRLVGFCLAIRRAVVEKIGGFDPRFATGNFEDDDFCLRARLAGFRLYIAEGAFIHHYGHQTFVGAGLDFAARMAENWRRFKEKWGLDPARPVEMGYPADLPARLKFDRALHYEPLHEVAGNG
ncbi:glycosyl transferase family 2 [Ammonifex degensii KC4]|uniref:Glycosyl transferase family 2 n=2 Tax=Ammonifex degensii TaxID=42838 RepID=C9RDC1_AMMDK|nr:glycosyl transferase family 2 [Ammonifex degensii KC4]